MTSIEYLDQQVKQIIPTADGISIKDWADKSSWRIDAKDITIEQRAALDALLATFDKTTFEAARPAVKTTEERLTELESRISKLEPVTVK